MRKELDYFIIEDSYGGCQDWFTDYDMYKGGCAAATACDSCIYLNLYKGAKDLYPYSKNEITKKDYIKFSQMMKPYLKPRVNGIDQLDIYIEGFNTYLKDSYAFDNISLDSFEGYRNVSEAKELVIEQINNDFLIPCLTLQHKNIVMKDYVWHWYLLTGYDVIEDSFLVKAVTYGDWRWLNFDVLWNTGYKKRGGLIIYDMD